MTMNNAELMKLMDDISRNSTNASYVKKKADFISMKAFADSISEGAEARICMTAQGLKLSMDTECGTFSAPPEIIGNLLSGAAAVAEQIPVESAQRQKKNKLISSEEAEAHQGTETRDDVYRTEALKHRSEEVYAYTPEPIKESSAESTIYKEEKEITLADVEAIESAETSGEGMISNIKADGTEEYGESYSEEPGEILEEPEPVEQEPEALDKHSPGETNVSESSDDSHKNGGEIQGLEHMDVDEHSEQPYRQESEREYVSTPAFEKEASVVSRLLSDEGQDTETEEEDIHIEIKNAESSDDDSRRPEYHERNEARIPEAPKKKRFFDFGKKDLNAAEEPHESKSKYAALSDEPLVFENRRNTRNAEPVAGNDDGGVVFKHTHNISVALKFNSESIRGRYTIEFWPTWIQFKSTIKAFADCVVRVTDEKGEEFLGIIDKKNRELKYRRHGADYGFKIIAVWEYGMLMTSVSIDDDSKYVITDDIEKEEPNVPDNDFLRQFKIEEKGQPAFFVIPLRNSNRGEAKVPIIATATNNGTKYILSRMKDNTCRYTYNNKERVLSGYWANNRFKAVVE